jgi:hypothetical protein
MLPEMLEVLHELIAAAGSGLTAVRQAELHAKLDQAAGALAEVPAPEPEAASVPAPA